ncbi:MAG: hypothetical protein R2883_00155 [Caldisericia bacterium]
MKNVEGEWLECSSLIALTYWSANATYGAGMYRENVNIGFDFEFYGQTYNQIEIGWNGYMNFGTQWYYYSSRYTYYGYSGSSYRYACVRKPLDYANSPPRINALGTLWGWPPNAEVCYGQAIWPATGETVFVVH